eukprot:13469809-Alexandrium_andersonii.AAC.1
MRRTSAGLRSLRTSFLRGSGAAYGLSGLTLRATLAMACPARDSATSGPRGRAGTSRLLSRRRGRS